MDSHRFRRLKEVPCNGPATDEEKIGEILKNLLLELNKIEGVI